jgi:hypothetical protein
MAGISIGIGAALTLLGIIGYAASGAASVTALIPAAFGILLTALGILARNERLRKHAMHAAALLAILGFAATVSGFVKLFTLIGGGTVERPSAVVAQSIMAVLCAVFVVMAIRSFILARRKK